MKYLNNFESFLNEGRSKYDGIASQLVKATFRQWIQDWNSGAKSSEFSEVVELQGLEFDLNATIYFDKAHGQKIDGFKVLDSTGADSRDYDEEDDTDQTPFIIIDFGVTSEWLPGYWQDIYMHLADVMRHEMEHITQGGEGIGNYRPGKPSEDDSFTRSLITQGLLPQSTYLMLPKEVDANLHGLRFEAKKRKEPMSDAVNRYLDTQDLSDEERNNVLNLWRERAKKIGGIPSF
jgi:hypothetical protein